jgi:hypothetical protein
MYFYQFRQISFGNSKVDINLCNPETAHYSIKDGKLPDLKNSQATFVVTHNAKVLPDLKVSLKVTESNTLNVKWTFDKLPDDWRTPFEIPNEIIEIKNPRQYVQLSKYVEVTDKPFGLKVLNSQGAAVLTIEELFLHSYLNYVVEKANTTKGDAFTGIFGLGERAQKTFFYEDGIYNMWNHDDGMPIEDGRPASKALYGTHPFYMYKNDDNSWVGVFHKLAANQDYIVQNDKDTGVVQIT